MNIVDLLEEAGYRTKKEGATNGGEYSSPCPFCREGNDRFRSWPDLINNCGYKGGRYWCRRCEEFGDAINFLRKLYDMSYRDACAKLKIDVGRMESKTKEWRPKTAENPPSLWQVKAGELIEWSHSQLMINKTFLFALKKRGLTECTIKTFKLGYIPNTLFREYSKWGLKEELGKNKKPRRIWLPSGVVIPSFEDEVLVRVKIRRDMWKMGDSYPKYVELPGNKKCPSIYGDQNISALIVIESELDAMLIQQEAGDLCCCLALSGSGKRLDLHTERLVRKANPLLFCPDFDEAGKKSWDRWIKSFPKTKRILTPYGKDPTEAFEHGTNLRQWVDEGIKKCLTVESNRYA